MGRGPLYFDVTGDMGPWPCFPEHAALLAELGAQGFEPLLAMKSDAGLEWSVVVDASGQTSVSVLITLATPHLYMATCLEDGTVLETEWRPTWRFLRPLGPAVWLDDRPAQRWRTLAPRGDVNTLVSAHAELRDRHVPRSPAMLWTVDSYLQFRVGSRWLGHINRGARRYMATRFLMALDVLVVLALFVRRPPLLLACVVFASYVVSKYLFVSRLTEWMTAMVAKKLSVERRERLARIEEEADDG